MTVTRMVAQVRQEIDRANGEPVVLVGSSLGAFVAVNTAAADDRVKGLVLLAPAFDFGGDERGRLGTVSIADWKAAGSAQVFHYAWNRPEHLDYTLYDDARRYEAFALQLQIPILIFQGSRDDVVNPEVVRRWAEGKPNVRLVIVDDDHQLHQSLDAICAATRAFVTKLRAVPPSSSSSPPRA